jgi:hypothetical protein
VRDGGGGDVVDLHHQEVKLYHHPPLCFHDSQLNPCTTTSILSVSEMAFRESAMAERVGYLEQDLAGRQAEEEDQRRQAAQVVPATHRCRSVSLCTALH